MNKVTVKSYNLINFTKKQYLITQTVVFSLILTLLLVLLFTDFTYTGFGYDKTILLVIAILEGGETYFMLKKFKEKEALQR